MHPECIYLSRCTSGVIRSYRCHAIKDIKTNLKPRARQNVVFEFGLFVGKLGRNKVCCLYKGNVKLPSDLDGLVYIPFNLSINEKQIDIIRELKAAGYKVKV